MGNWISTSSKLAPISAASTIIGFLEFPLTILTLLKVVWEDISTAKSAENEITVHLLDS